MNKTTFDTRIDKALDWQTYAILEATLAKDIDGKEIHVTQELIDKHKDKAKAQLRTLVNDVCLEIIGEDARWNHKVESIYAGSRHDMENAVNRKLKQQRTKLATILEGSE